MEEKVLNLKLKYKDQELDIAKYNRDFKSKFYIGSAKDIFWQILDESFPKKFNLIKKQGNKFLMQLRKGMQVNVIKNGKELKNNELKSANLIKDNSLIIEMNSNGSVQFAGDWKIEFFFMAPYKYTPTREEIRLAHEFAKRPPLSSEQKFTRIFIILGLLITSIGLYIAEKNYEPPQISGLKERLRRIDEISTRVIPEFQEEETEAVTEGAEAEPTQEEAQEQKEQAEAIAAEDFKERFGLDLDIETAGSTDLSKEIVEITQADEIVAASVAIKGDGGGTGPGPGKPGTGGSSLDNIASATEIGKAEGLGDLGDLEGLDIGGGSGFEEIDLASLGGETGDFKITKIKSKAQFEEVKKRLTGIKAVKEGSIKLEEITPEAKTEIANITQQINTYKHQIKRLFIVESMVMDMYGSIEFELIIEKSGKIAAVNFKESEGSFFTESFYTKVRNAIMDWNIKVKEPIIFIFRRNFLKGS